MNLDKTVLVGSLWAVGMRWGVRALGAISIVVLARLLKPEDFGILAMAMMLVAALSIFTEVGVSAMLIRDQHVTDADLNTAWTIRIVQGLIVAILVAMLAEPLAAYFREPRVVAVVYVCALALAMNAFENIGVVLIRKELDFARDFRYQMYTKVVGVVATIGLAFWLRSYWALAFAKCVAALAHVALSFGMHRYRPRLSLSRWRRFIGFSTAMLLTDAARLVTGRAPSFVVGSIGGAAQMGAYNVAGEIASVGPNELTMSVGRAMFPTLARLRDDRAAMVSMFMRVLGTVALLSLPMGLGLWVVADDFVPVLLGKNWESSRDLLKYLAIAGMLAALGNLMLGHVLLLTGHHHRQTAAQWVRCAIVVACALAGLPFGATGIAIGAMVASAVTLVLILVLLRVTLPCRVVDFAAILWRPTAASVAMAAVVHFVARELAVTPPLRLAISVALGALAYVVFAALLWLASGRPAGAEASALATIRARLRRPRR